LKNDPDNNSGRLDDTYAIIGGFYFEPVSQVTIGLNADYRQKNFEDNSSGDDVGTGEQFNVRFVTYLRF